MTSIDWDRAREIFGYPQPPREVSERQFDNFHDELTRLAKMPWEKIDFSDLWYYHNDLAYVDLQPEVFAYLFPVCLMDWHQTLQSNQPCSHGDAEFHNSMRRGQILERMVTPYQRTQIYEFFRDSFLERLDMERGHVYLGEISSYGWIARFNSLGFVMPRIDMIWKAWWALDTPGRAVAALQYCSGLIYFEVPNPCAGKLGGPFLAENDCMIHDTGWLPENLQFIRETLTPDFVIDKVELAINVLRGQPEYEIARDLQKDLPERLETLVCRIGDVPEFLADPNKHELGSWSPH